MSVLKAYHSANPWLKFSIDYSLDKLVATEPYIRQENLTQKEAAQRLKVSQPRISNLVHSKIDLFSADMLLSMLERAGFSIYKKIEADASHFFRKYSAHHTVATHAR